LFPELLQFNIQKSKTRNPVILNFEFFSFGNQFYFYFVSVEWQGKIKAKISTQKSKKFSQTFLRFWVWATPTKNFKLSQIFDSNKGKNHAAVTTNLPLFKGKSTTL